MAQFMILSKHRVSPQPARGDIIYNSRLQMVNINQDKYILLVHQGGDLV
jgi:hypothetical protein